MCQGVKCIEEQNKLGCKLHRATLKQSVPGNKIIWGAKCVSHKGIHTTYSWNIKWQKCAGISGLWVLNEIIQQQYPENLKKIVGAVLKLPAKGQ